MELSGTLVVARCHKPRVPLERSFLLELVDIVAMGSGDRRFAELAGKLLLALRHNLACLLSCNPPEPAMSAQ